MANKHHHRTRACIRRQARNRGLAEDLAVIHGDFADYLRARGYAPFSVDFYERHLVRMACWLRAYQRGPALHELTRQAIPRLLAKALPHCCPKTKRKYYRAVVHWLRFKGRYSEPIDRPWVPWLNDYLQFLQTHRGVGQSTLEANETNAKAFMEHQFGARRANWSQVKPADIWSFARHRIRGVKPITGKHRLGCVRRFLRFVHLKGACMPQLAAAIPRIAVYGGGSRRPEVLTQQQRRRLLASFRRTTLEGKRDYAMTLCMLDLGLRGGEVIGLRLQDIDWRTGRLTVRVTKTGRGRQLPLPAHVLEALGDYVRVGRPQNFPSDHVFLRHFRRRGYPVSRGVLQGVVRLAYRRCAFPPGWAGTHRLRHTFASRLYQSGVDMKPIADLLGHQHLDSTNIYTQVDMRALRQVAQRWPWQV